MADEVHKPRLVGINHVALEVGDLDAALDFYARVFDFELRGRIPGMAFLDMGDQFLALSEWRRGPPDADRHFGLVVDDKEAPRRRLAAEGLDVRPSGGLDFSAPWGNFVQVVDYREIQFMKTGEILRILGLDGMDKTAEALRELREKGIEP